MVFSHVLKKYFINKNKSLYYAPELENDKKISWETRPELSRNCNTNRTAEIQSG
jgi:hypothetical protein